MNYKRLQIIIFCLILLAGCTGNKRVKNKLTQAERIVYSAPDSALQILSGMDRSGLQDEHILARYALLYTQAQEGCGIQPENDSLICLAWKYYKKYPRELRNQCKVLYYWGCIRLQKGDYPGALRLFLQNEEKLQEVDDPYYLGRLYQSIGEVYYAELNYVRAYNYFSEAYPLFVCSGNIPERVKNLLAMTATSLWMRDVEQAGYYATIALELAEGLQDKPLISRSLAYTAVYYVLSGKHPVSSHLLRRMERSARGDISGSSCRTLACVHQLNGRPDSARYYLKLAEANTSDIHELSLLLYMNFQMNMQAENFRQATGNLCRYIHLTDSLTHSKLNTSAGMLEGTYLRTRTAFVKYRMRNRIRWEITGACIVVLLLGAGGLLLRQRMRWQRIRNEHYLLLIEEAQSEYGKLSEQMNVQYDTEKNLKGLIASRFQVIDKLGRVYYERENSSSQQAAIFQQFTEIVSGFSGNGEMWQELEKIVNTVHDNVMEKLHSDFPAMKQSDRRLLCYIFGGFSPQVISLFMGDNVANIYARKSRLKARIKNSGSPHSPLFLSLLGQVSDQC